MNYGYDILYKEVERMKKIEILEMRKNLESDLLNCNIEENLEDYTSSSGFIDYVRDNNLCNEDIIYYYNAIEYLKENDSSLRESMGIAAEFGYKTEDINSELLASLLKSQTRIAPS